MNKKFDIFISYRRGSGLYMAKNIASSLSSMGYKVFFDYTSTVNGVFDQQIFKAIESAHDFILVLSEGSLDSCYKNDDWVRMEVMHAKKHNKNFILATDAERFKQYPSNLPSEMNFIKKIDWTPIHPKLFEGSIQLLKKRLKTKRNLWKQVTVAITAVALILIGLLLYIYIPTNNTKTFVSDEVERTVEMLTDYERIEDADDFDDVFPDEMEVLFVFSSTSNRADKTYFLVEDFEEIDGEKLGKDDDELKALINAMADYTEKEYYNLVKKSIAATQPQLKEDMSPTKYNSGAFRWIIYRFYDEASEKHLWRMSAKYSDTLFMNVLISSDKKNFLTEKHFLVNIKHMLKAWDSILYEYMSEEY